MGEEKDCYEVPREPETAHKQFIKKVTKAKATVTEQSKIGQITTGYCMTAQGNAGAEAPK